MTFAEYVKDYLFQSGMFPDQAETVLTLVKGDKANEAMQTRDGDKVIQDRWEEDMEGYPPVMQALVRFATNRDAVAWIEANLPQAWYRLLFANEEVTQ